MNNSDIIDRIYNKELSIMIDNILKSYYLVTLPLIYDNYVQAGEPNVTFGQSFNKVLRLLLEIHYRTKQIYVSNHDYLDQCPYPESQILFTFTFI